MVKRTEIITPNQLTSMSQYTSSYPINIDLVYAKLEHTDNHFKVTLPGSISPIPLYKSDAAMLAHKSMADIILSATKYLPAGYSLSLKDIFRSGDAQLGMSYCHDKYGKPYPTNLVSKPGQGAHPLGMAADIMLKKDGVEVDAGTPFDYFDVDAVARNELPKSSRLNTNITGSQKANQRLLETAMMRAALDHGRLLMPPEEKHLILTDTYYPILDEQLPDSMKMTNGKFAFAAKEAFKKDGLLPKPPFSFLAID
ncbi:MAG: hypothetical protein MK137_03305 [Rickettsiales bacterium]|nr:hypothetical protein [Rickettsiales bacterium]